MANQLVMVMEIANIVEIWGEEQSEKIRESIARKGNNANGDQFAASFKPLEVEISEGAVIWKMEAPSWYDVIDKGGKRWVKGKMPPVNPIMEWMAHKGIQAIINNHSTHLAKAIKRNKESKTWHTQTKYQAQRSMAFAIAINIKKHGVIKRFGGNGSNFYSDVMNPQAFLELRKRIIEKTANPEFIFKFIDPNQKD